MLQAARAPDVPVAERRHLALYFSLLTVTLGFSDPTGVIGLPLQFILKDRLHLGPQGLALFEAIILVPSYIGFLSGWIRDRWRPRRFGDHGYFLLAGPVALACYLYLSLPAMSIDYGRLLGTIFLAALAFEMMGGVAEAMMTSAGQRYAMTGRLSAIDEIAQTCADVAALAAGGWLASHAAPQTTFLVAAASTCGVVAMGFWRPASVTAAIGAPTSKTAGRWFALDAIPRMRPLWVVVAMVSLWNFSPGWSTPLFYRLTSTVGLSPQAYGLFRAASYASVAGATVLYGYLCQRQPVGRVLKWAISANIFAGALFFLIAGPWQAITIGILVGLLNGFSNVALFDIARRSCPAELEGTGTMAVFSAWAIAGTAGDLFGSWVYAHAGFVACIAIDAMTNALILPMIVRLPRGLLESRDGRP